MKKLFGCLLVCGAILLLILLVTGTLPAVPMFIMTLFTDWRGPFDKPRFEAIVEEVRLQRPVASEGAGVRLVTGSIRA